MGTDGAAANPTKAEHSTIPDATIRKGHKDASARSGKSHLQEPRDNEHERKDLRRENRMRGGGVL